MTAAHPTPDAPQDHHTPDPALYGHGPAGHHGSWAPIIIASSVGFLYLALLWPMYMLPIGVPLAILGIGWWIREDIIRFRQISHLPQEEHGRPGPWWGMALFIATEVLIFGSLFAIWFMGSHHAVGSFRPQGLELPITATAINTAVLVSSGATLHWGMIQLKRDRYKGYLTGLFLTLILGATFLIQQIREYLELIHEQGLTISGYKDVPHLYGSAFFMLTGTHGAHVAGGLLFLTIVFARSLKRGQTKEHHVALETAAMYWHFVDVVWIFLFGVVYLELL